MTTTLLPVRLMKEEVWLWVKECGFVFPRAKLDQENWEQDIRIMRRIEEGLR